MSNENDNRETRPCESGSAKNDTTDERGSILQASDEVHVSSEAQA